MRVSDIPDDRGADAGRRGAGDTLHLIREATDDGAPALTRYRGVIVTVRP